ncbi:hypothetical protein BDB00DRAFT_786737 [Zychaea mexicana]|uniref:uncharacterized protein n=1 Tax=Zychaea mexicana TaxID=64656 RepID=UPI0022FEC7F4|nr:uncharacterized protein BDB00DRAFT_786737 [Zychaea mexicana]KAI9494882.1 hypothetical protein BDB00DRAFT_786737 [Zychaea mexicana]
MATAPINFRDKVAKTYAMAQRIHQESSSITEQVALVENLLSQPRQQENHHQNNSEKSNNNVNKSFGKRRQVIRNSLIAHTNQLVEALLEFSASSSIVIIEKKFAQFNYNHNSAVLCTKNKTDNRQSLAPQPLPPSSLLPSHQRQEHCRHKKSATTTTITAVAAAGKDRMELVNNGAPVPPENHNNNAASLAEEQIQKQQHMVMDTDRPAPIKMLVYKLAEPYTFPCLKLPLYVMSALLR